MKKKNPRNSDTQEDRKYVNQKNGFKNNNNQKNTLKIYELERCFSSEIHVGRLKNISSQILD